MIIVKIGGGERINLDGIVQDLASLNQPFIAVHGANYLRDQVAQKLGIEKRVITSVSGYSSTFSDDNAIDAILMAYSGLRNKRLVERFQQAGVNAVGLTGLDGRVVQGARNSGIRVIENGKKIMKHDLSGKPRQINTALLELLMENGYAPVLTIPICDENGFAINSENDDIVCALQAATKTHTVIQLIEAAGFLDDASDPDSVIAKMSHAELEKREHTVEGRIKRKLHALNKLVKNGVGKVIICDGRTDSPISDALAGGGTWIE